MHLFYKLLFTINCKTTTTRWKKFIYIWFRRILKRGCFDGIYYFFSRLLTTFCSQVHSKPHWTLKNLEIFYIIRSNLRFLRVFSQCDFHNCIWKRSIHCSFSCVYFFLFEFSITLFTSIQQKRTGYFLCRKSFNQLFPDVLVLIRVHRSTF